MYIEGKRGKTDEQANRCICNGRVILRVSSQIIEVKQCTLRVREVRPTSKLTDASVMNALYYESVRRS
jgi:hypothetical protein